MTASGSLAVERWFGAAPVLENMSCRPDTAIVHPSNDASRQLAGAFRVELPKGWWTQLRSLATVQDARYHRMSLTTLERWRNAVADAVRDDLGLPSVVAVAPARELPSCEVSRDPLLAFGLLVRRSGPVWLARRRPAFEGLEGGGTLTLLLPPAALDALVRRTTHPGWRSAVLAQAVRLETTR